MVDFHDLEQHALRLLWIARPTSPPLSPPSGAEKLRFIFVDEYQDINAAQDRIIEALAEQALVPIVSLSRCETEHLPFSSG